MIVLRPSSAATWMNCPGQPALLEALAERAVEQETTYYQAEGTAAHTVAQIILDAFPEEPEIPDTLEVDGITIEVGDDMISYAQQYADRCLQPAGLEAMEVERTIAMPFLDPEGTLDAVPTGTPDCVTITQDGDLIVSDLKYGKGVAVDAQDNPQLKIYAVAALEEYGMAYDVERVVSRVDQPRLNHFPEAYYDPIELEAFKEEVERAAILARTSKPGENLVPGDAQCQWCPIGAAGLCKALAQHVAETCFEDLDAQELKDVDVSPEELSEWRSRADLVEKWAKAVRAAVDAQLNADPTSVPGWKLVEGRRGARAWSDEAQAEARLKQMRVKRDEMYSMKLITPTQAQKILSDKRYDALMDEGLIIQPDGKPIAVPESDKRPAIVSSVNFENLDEEKPNE